MTDQRTPTLLCILDGVGLAPPSDGNALFLSDTPTLDRLFRDVPNSRLRTDGAYVGLPEGQMGNSEVGHMAIGSGRIIRQSLAQITHDLATGDFQQIPSFKAFLDDSQGSRVIHLLGLLSDGGVHSHVNHILALAKNLCSEGRIVRIHAILDGRDADPKSGIGFIDQTLSEIASIENCEIATIIGRFYGMDRDKRWERMEKAWRLWTLAEGQESDSPTATLADLYEGGTTDEFIPPISCDNTDELSRIGSGDSVIVCNFRADRARQIVELMAQNELGSKIEPIVSLQGISTFTEYSSSFNDIAHVFYPNEEIADTLGEVIANTGRKQLRISETEKYAHITYYLNCGRETPYDGEVRILIDSPKEVATYDLKPEMSLPAVTDKLVDELAAGEFDLVVLNIANGDQVGHTGNIAAAKTAMKVVDFSVQRIIDALHTTGGQCLIIADHGNVEEMLIGTEVSTAHSTNPVPCIYVGPKKIRLGDGGLQDVAPTLLDLMGIDKPQLMTGRSLIL